MTDPAAIAAFVFVVMLVAHDLGDHWFQTSCMALRKGERGWTGSWACFKHVLSLTATKAAMLIGSCFITGVDLSIPVTSIIVVGDAITHYWCDRRFTLRWLSQKLGKEGFLLLGSPRDGKDDKPCLGTGLYILDQSFHKFWLLVAAIAIAVTAV